MNRKPFKDLAVKNSGAPIATLLGPLFGYTLASQGFVSADMPPEVQASIYALTGAVTAGVAGFFQRCFFGGE